MDIEGYDQSYGDVGVGQEVYPVGHGEGIGIIIIRGSGKLDMFTDDPLVPGLVTDTVYMIYIIG